MFRTPPSLAVGWPWPQEELRLYEHRGTEVMWEKWSLLRIQMQVRNKKILLDGSIFTAQFGVHLPEHLFSWAHFGELWVPFICLSFEPRSVTVSSSSLQTRKLETLVVIAEWLKYPDPRQCWFWRRTESFLLFEYSCLAPEKRFAACFDSSSCFEMDDNTRPEGNFIRALQKSSG